MSTIYDQGVNAVAATIRQLYDMIEVEDERVSQLVEVATSAHLKKIKQLTAHGGLRSKKNLRIEY